MKFPLAAKSNAFRQPPSA